VAAASGLAPTRSTPVNLASRSESRSMAANNPMTKIPAAHEARIMIMRLNVSHFAGLTARATMQAMKDTQAKMLANGIRGDGHIGSDSLACCECERFEESFHVSLVLPFMVDDQDVKSSSVPNCKHIYL